MSYLSKLDEILLLSVWRLNENAYAVPLINDIKSRTGKTITPGALWVSLDNLKKKGYLRKRLADSTNEIGGRGKLYYGLSSEGLKALKEVKKINESIWEDIPEMNVNKA